jgi:phosphoribosylformylglycinamidine synthase
LVLRLAGSHGGTVPKVRLKNARRTFSAIHRAIRAGVVQACHDLSEGGLAVAATEMAIAGGLGLEIELASMPLAGADLPEATRLFAESPTRFLVEVGPDDVDQFEQVVARVPHARIGRVVTEPRFTVSGSGGAVIDAEVSHLKQTWQAPLAEVKL